MRVREAALTVYFVGLIALMAWLMVNGFAVQ